MAKKTFFLLALMLGIIMIATGYKSGSNRPSSLGKNVPTIPVETINLAIKNAETQHKYALLSFWSSSDAASRSNCNKYTAWINAHPEAPVEFIAVNFDKTKLLFDEIVRLDSLMPETQYNVNGPDADVIRTKFDIKRGYGTVLVGPDGKIKAHNPSDAYLDRLLG